MPRQPRIEYDGAVYHVMCRGDRREVIFLSDEDRRLFLQTLGQACERAGWKVHCYVLMNNHYHLLLETPHGGLVDGMRWLQTTYTARFNARHQMCGHLFQGRYKALVIDPDEPEYFRVVSNYIHLNPARAGLLNGEIPRLEAFGWSSYPAYIGRAKAPAWLETGRVLDAHQTTRRGYAEYMRRRVLDVLKGSEEMTKEWNAIRRGWYLGTEAFRERLLDYVEKRMGLRKRESYAGEAVKGHDERAAERLLQEGLRRFGVSLTEVRGWKTTDERKQALCWVVRSSTLVSSGWICERLGMGHRSNISRAVRRMERAQRGNPRRLKQIMLRCKD